MKTITVKIVSMVLMLALLSVPVALTFMAGETAAAILLGIAAGLLSSVLSSIITFAITGEFL